MNEGWNILSIKHKGPHPFEYHHWVYENMWKASQEAGLDWDLFVAKFNKWVRDIIDDDESITFGAYWDCYR